MPDVQLQDHACGTTVSPLQEEMTESGSKPITSSLPWLSVCQEPYMEADKTLGYEPRDPGPRNRLRRRQTVGSYSHPAEPIDMQSKSIHGCGSGALLRAHRPALASTSVIAHPLWPRISLVSIVCSSALLKTERVISCPDDRSAKQAGSSALETDPRWNMDAGESWIWWSCVLKRSKVGDATLRGL